MPKPDPALLDPARYPFSCSIETRFGDLDVNQHLNNVSVVGLLEEGRVRYHRAAGSGAPPRDMAPMVVSLSVEFLGQSYFPDPMEVRIAVGPLGRTSYTLYHLLSQRGRPVAFAQATVVATADGVPAELPAAFREAMQGWTLRP